ncbi:uncharacterized protein ACWYII_022362 [Salvelinus alpinus]
MTVVCLITGSNESAYRVETRTSTPDQNLHARPGPVPTPDQDLYPRQTRTCTHARPGPPRHQDLYPCQTRTSTPDQDPHARPGPVPTPDQDLYPRQTRTCTHAKPGPVPTPRQTRTCTHARPGPVPSPDQDLYPRQTRTCTNARPGPVPTSDQDLYQRQTRTCTHARPPRQTRTSTPDQDLYPRQTRTSTPDQDLYPHQTRTCTHARPGPVPTPDQDLYPRQTRTSTPDQDLYPCQTRTSKPDQDLHARPGPVPTPDQNLHNRLLHLKLFATFSSLLNPPPPPPPSSLSADDFVNHFEKKVDDIRSSFAKSNDTAGSAHTALPCALTSFSPLSPDEISRLVTAGRPTTCPLDPIPSSLLQTISGDLLPYLTSLINSSLTAGYVPSVFKRARVAPLLKKPTLDPSDVNNYRPVSLLSFLSKTLERAVLGQLSCYLSQNDLLDPNQSGFKTSHSTETALLCVTEALRTAKANSLSSALILLDLLAAFDTVNHQILLSTLSELGISGVAHAWIASYLTGRSYQVVNRISACLADISVWMTDHHLKLNLGKTELLFLPWKDCPFHDLAITVDNSIVSSSQSAKNLGVILDNTLSFSTNIKAVTRSCRFMLYNIRRVRPCLTQEAAQVLIQALVISRLDYCNSLRHQEHLDIGAEGALISS